MQYVYTTLAFNKKDKVSKHNLKIAHLVLLTHRPNTTKTKRAILGKRT